MKSQNRHGMVMVVAIVLMGLLGVGLAMLTELVGANIRRGRLQSESAQARQILVAANWAMLKNPNARFELPRQVSDMGGRMKIVSKSRTADKTVFEIEAGFGRANATELLTLAERKGAWEISGVEVH